VSRFREDQAENGLTSLVVVAASITIGLVREGGGLSSLTTDACSHPRCRASDQPVASDMEAPRWGHQIGTEAPMQRTDDRDQAHGHEFGTFSGPRHV
jgi:hypothetical protein